MHNISLHGLLNKVGVNIAPTVSGVLNRVTNSTTHGTWNIR